MHKLYTSTALALMFGLATTGYAAESKTEQQSGAPQADEVMCLATPQLFFAIGAFYEDFRQVSDDEVVDLLRRATPFAAEPASTELVTSIAPFRGRFLALLARFLSGCWLGPFWQQPKITLQINSLPDRGRGLQNHSADRDSVAKRIVGPVSTFWLQMRRMPRVRYRIERPIVAC